LRLLSGCQRLFAFAPNAVDFSCQARCRVRPDACDFFLECEGRRALGVLARLLDVGVAQQHRLRHQPLECGARVRFGRLARLGNSRVAGRVGFRPDARQLRFTLRIRLGSRLLEGRLAIRLGPHLEQLDFRSMYGSVHRGVLRRGIELQGDLAPLLLARTGRTKGGLGCRVHAITQGQPACRGDGSGLARKFSL
jgi:hypothetical protein